MALAKNIVNVNIMVICLYYFTILFSSQNNKGKKRL